MALDFARPKLIEFDRAGTVIELSEHNRGPLEIDYERIEQAERMWDGTRRSYYIADKRTWSCEWTMLPGDDDSTVDGLAGLDSMEEFYRDTHEPFTMTLVDNDNNEESYLVAFTEFSKGLQKRWDSHYYDVSITVEEV